MFKEKAWEIPGTFISREKHMRVIRTIAEMRELRRSMGPQHSVGFVPTMGFLHDGHLSLMRMARKDCSVVGSSLFVNPTQFGPNEDFDRYPRNFERDFQMMEKEKLDFLFAPEKEEMYPPNFKTFVNLEGIDTLTREGAARPGFFRGVATVCTKLFNIISPNRVYFGQKDGIQCVVINTLVRDLNLPIEVVIGATVREPDGLAMSSRNAYLSPEDRPSAPTLFKGLSESKKRFEEGESDAQTLIRIAEDIIRKEEKMRLDYIDICDLQTGQKLSKVGENGALLSGAVWLGKTRLIDNVILKW